VDIKGAEYTALSEFPFDEYKFGAINIEHNNQEDRRAKIRELLVKSGPSATRIGTCGPTSRTPPLQRRLL
jgi:hypothetical protein